MDTNILIIVLLVLVVIALAAVLWTQNRRSKQLQSRFGPEYERAVEESGDRKKAEAELLQREERVKKLSIRPIPPEHRERFIEDWRRIQAEFVDDPEASTIHADVLLQEVMAARGYPVENFEQAAADISVDHPRVVQNFRTGHDIALRHSKGEADTEDLRKAMIHYRELFDELVTDEEAARQQPKTRRRHSDDSDRR